MAKVKLPWLYQRRVEAGVRAICRANDESVGLAALEHLPPLQGTLPGRCPDGIIFAACDDRYFYKYGKNFAQTAIERSPGQSLHLHIYNPSLTTLDTMNSNTDWPSGRISISWEHTQPHLSWPEGNAHIYFAAVRFVRLWQVLGASFSSIIVLDVDSEIRQSLTESLVEFRNNDVSLFLRPKASKVWRRILAAAAVFSPTDTGRRFLRDLSASIVHNLQNNPTYHIDQMIIYFVWKWYANKEAGFRTGKLTRNLSDWEFDDESLVWHAKGSRKEILGETWPEQ